MRALPALLTLAIVGALPAQTAAERTLAELGTEAKAGQLFMSWILSRAEGQDGERDRLRRWIRDAGLGGVILSLGSTVEARALIPTLQAEARVPLLIASDFETSVAYRLTGATDLGNAMLLGAGGSTRLAREAGRITAREGRALGFHQAFAPVVDVNSNPANPIINVRSFGEDPELVARLGAAFVRGLQEEGMLATAKHFPGHGDVDSDSHLELPTVPGDRARLDRIELPPFRATIAAGVASIMTGHLAVPGLGEQPDVPATLSRHILGDVLRRELGFDGLIVTDALEMGGVKNAAAPDEVAVRALLAGADLLLMPPDPVAARAAVVRAVRDGRVSEARLDEAVLRILRAKERVGLLGGAAGLPHVDAPAHATIAAEIAQRGITVVRDPRGLWPWRSPGSHDERGTLVTLLDADQPGRGETFRAQITSGSSQPPRLHRLHPGSTEAEVQAAVREVSELPTTIALHVAVGPGVPSKLAPVLDALANSPSVVAVSFGSPYLLEQLPENAVCLCAYGDGPSIERAAFGALIGRSVSGRLPVSIPGQAPAGAGLTYLTADAEVSRTTPEREGFAADLDARVRALLTQAIDDGAFPGAVALVARRDVIVCEVAVGRQTYDPQAPSIRNDSLFDLASLTKVCATAPTVLRLIDQGKLSLDTRVGTLLPEFRAPDKDTVTLRHLLTHTAGLAASRGYFRQLEGKAAIVAAAAGEDLVAQPGTTTIYSDLGLILLMACVEKVAGLPFEVVARREVFEPLGMRSALFATTGTPIEAVPTERCEWRGTLVRGQAHDENAYAMGGVAGHAGLFATAEDVARLGIAFLGGGRRWLSPLLARQAIEAANVVQGSSRALAWDTFRPAGSGGSLLSARAFGHTGFTGTSIWCDPRTDLCIVLLTNRVHPTRTNDRISAVRRDLADLVSGSLVDR